MAAPAPIHAGRGNGRTYTAADRCRSGKTSTPGGLTDGHLKCHSNLHQLDGRNLRAGVLEDGIVTVEEKGTGQGSVISPCLSNVYLHYVFDLWAARWRRREATGDMIMVRYADDIVVGFQHESDARRFRDAMRDRLREFSLSLHPAKTRLIEFGRFAAQNCKRRGRSKPETFTFLGFVLICDKSQRGDFRIRRKSRRDRMRAKLR